MCPYGCEETVLRRMCPRHGLAAGLQTSDRAPGTERREHTDLAHDVLRDIAVLGVTRGRPTCQRHAWVAGTPEADKICPAEARWAFVMLHPGPKGTPCVPVTFSACPDHMTELDRAIDQALTETPVPLHCSDCRVPWTRREDIVSRRWPI